MITISKLHIFSTVARESRSSLISNSKEFRHSRTALNCCYAGLSQLLHHPVRKCSIFTRPLTGIEQDSHEVQCEPNIVEHVVDRELILIV